MFSYTSLEVYEEIPARENEMEMEKEKWMSTKQMKAMIEICI